MRDEVAWWLDLFRWEFPLPERDALADALADGLSYFRTQGLMSSADGATVNSSHPLAWPLLGMVENFREAYWIAAVELAQLSEKGVGRKTLLQTMRKRFETHILLGDVSKPEANSVVTLGNALSRYAEIGLVTLVAGKGKDPAVRRGPKAADLPHLIGRLGTPFGRAGGDIDLVDPSVPRS